MTTNRDILLRAADRIERDGWHKGSLALTQAGEIWTEALRRNAPCCALGALFAESGWLERDENYSTQDLESAVLAALGLDDDSTLPHWNDYIARDQAEVVAALRAAAELVES